MTRTSHAKAPVFQKLALQGVNSVRLETPSRHNALTYLHPTQLGNDVTKDELRAELERQEQRYKDVYGGEVTTYAAQPEPERKPWRKRASLLDQAFAQEIQKIEEELKTEEP